MKKIHSKMKALELSQYVSHFKSIGTFTEFTEFTDFFFLKFWFRHSRTANSAVRGRIWSNFELIQDFMVVIVTCKNEVDPNKNKIAHNISLFITLWELAVAMEPGFSSDLAQNLIHSLPYPNDASVKINCN